MSFPTKLFAIKGNLVFMNNLYYKVAVASVCTALGFALGATKEAKAATLTLAPSADFAIINETQYSSTGWIKGGPASEIRSLYEFDISSLPNTYNSYILSIKIPRQINNILIGNNNFPANLYLSGYVGNGIPDISDYLGGELLNVIYTQDFFPGDVINFNVTSFVNLIYSNNNAFVGFNLRADSGELPVKSNQSVLIAYIPDTDSEPVPEPTTIFGSALALTLGGWLKGKKLNLQDKATPQS